MAIPQKTATISLVVPAAGCGARANLNGNKVLAPLCGQPLLWHTLRALLSTEQFNNAQVAELIVVARRDEWRLVREIVESVKSHFDDLLESAHHWQIIEGEERAADDKFLIRLIEGGATRQDSVEAGAKAAIGDFVLVHDAARPLLSAQLTARVVEAAMKSGAAIAALPASDTVKRAVHNAAQQIISETLPREEIWLAQTPQVFQRDILLQALQEARRNNFSGTDCSSLVERLRDGNGNALYSVVLVPGEERNFKVTFAADLERAASLLNDENHLSQ